MTLAMWSEVRGWETRRERLDEIRSPAGFVIAPYDERLIVLDLRGAREPLRLFSVDPESGKTTSLGELESRGADRASIGVGQDGRIVLALTRGQETELAHVIIRDGRPVIVDRYQTAGQLLGDIVEDDTTIRFTVIVGDRPEARTVELRSFETRK